MTGVILAGGRSSRMGSDKAGHVVAGRPMIEWVGAALDAVSDRVVVAGRDDPVAGYAPIPDPGPSHRGPLAGVVAALEAFGDAVVVVATDQPWVRAETLRGLIERMGDLPVVPVDGGIRQTTCAVYPPTVAAAARTELEEGGSLQSLLDVVAFQQVVDWRAWGEDGRSWYSVDTPEDAAEGLARFGAP
ncbi:MAG: molybdenum cofactor guanylyltransferase [Actinomycetes bacterium]|jgi:molybdopterin-guanine dinucleotide biosynthesis protein A|nr:molybdenum cofactor guanylyltransferase [Acidimicrobiia bacterium]